MKKTVSNLTKDLKVIDEILTLEFNGEKIEVSGYLPIEKKYQLVNWVISQSRRNSVTNHLSRLDLEKKFDIALVNYYTDYKFDIVNKEEYNKAYDILNTNGFFDLVLTGIPEQEYNKLVKIMEEEISKDQVYHNSVAGSINKLLDKFNNNLESANKALETLKDFDIEKYGNVATIADKMGISNNKVVKLDTKGKE